MRDKKAQVGGEHYSKYDIQVFDIIKEYNLDFFEGNALKYLLRYRDKNGFEDLDKCIDYLKVIKDNYGKPNK